MIKSMIEQAVRGSVELNFAEEGLHWSLQAPESIFLRYALRDKQPVAPIWSPISRLNRTCVPILQIASAIVGQPV